MFEAASLALALFGAYAVVGLSFAIAFVTAGIRRLDPAARGAPLSVRLLLIPGSAALWPVLLGQWLRAVSAGQEARR